MPTNNQTLHSSHTRHRPLRQSFCEDPPVVEDQLDTQDEEEGVVPKPWKLENLSVQVPDDTPTKRIRTHVLPSPGPGYAQQYASGSGNSSSRKKKPDSTKKSSDLQTNPAFMMNFPVIERSISETSATEDRSPNPNTSISFVDAADSTLVSGSGEEVTLSPIHGRVLPTPDGMVSSFSRFGCAFVPSEQTQHTPDGNGGAGMGPGHPADNVSIDVLHASSVGDVELSSFEHSASPNSSSLSHRPGKHGAGKTHATSHSVMSPNSSATSSTPMQPPHTAKSNKSSSSQPEGRTRTASERSGSTRDGETSSSGLRILVAEDNKMNQKLITRVLSKLGHNNVDVAENGRIAVEFVMKKDQYDLILMDIMMPEMDGLEATTRIKAYFEANKHSSVCPPIVALTANTLDQDIERCMGVGMIEVVPKPLKIKKLEKVINTVCHWQ